MKFGLWALRLRHCVVGVRALGDARAHGGLEDVTALIFQSLQVISCLVFHAAWTDPGAKPEWAEYSRRENI